MPFHAAPPLPQRLAELMPLPRGDFELERGRHAGREIHYVDAGPRDADAIVMIHGNPTWSFLWRKVIAALPQRRCVAPDLLGFGLSSRLPHLADHTVDGHADAIAQVLEALQLRSFVLVGQDWGGPIAACVGARLPDRVRGLVFANTSVVVPERPKGTWFHRFARMRGISEVAFIGLGMPQRVLWSVQGDRSSMRGATGSAYTWPLRRFRDRVGPLALARMVPDSIAHPSVDALRRGQAFVAGFGGPAALVWGTKDPILGRALERHRRLLPQAEVTVTQAGHFLQEEVPEALVTAIEGVWRRADAARSATGN
ncbi:MAG: alpha/beta fold hydrolase [Deltaproteobacteria bacterium]|nr:alpha/beta fold hydrolase [Deltaproteobacteria bacterium]MBK8238375.1 alpha/beta fold hydrolase [Deltaproteobacteria bacterium]MBK8717203.1 alpha/beta fold hydrolase [Deltaproteobacteria bacterium]MBP7286081.1 alpha/beta fold hydrolase [Nannocystaceae bacterium]